MLDSLGCIAVILGVGADIVTEVLKASLHIKHVVAAENLAASVHQESAVLDLNTVRSDSAVGSNLFYGCDCLIGRGVCVGLNFFCHLCFGRT